MLNALAATPTRQTGQASSIHRLQTWTTRVSNPVCYPRFRALASEQCQEAAFATGIPPDINEFHLYTRNSTSLSLPLDYQFQMQFRGWAPGFHIWLNNPPALALRPVIPSNACTIRITAAAGTDLAGAFLW